MLEDMLYKRKNRNSMTDRRVNLTHGYVGFWIGGQPIRLSSLIQWDMGILKIPPEEFGPLRIQTCRKAIEKFPRVNLPEKHRFI